MILSVGHTKGGVGKSTISVQIAAYLRSQRNIDLLLIDTGPQRSAAKSIMERNDDPDLPSINCATYTTGKELLQQLRTIKDKYQEIIIDIGARESDSLMMTDVLLIPVVPRGYDLDAIDDVYKLLQSAWDLGSECKAAAFISLADSQGSANNEAREYLSDYPDIEMLETAIHRRKGIGAASLHGLSVCELTGKDRDAKACNEVENLIEEIYGE